VPAGKRLRMRPTDLSTAKRLLFLGLIASLVATAAIAIGVLLFSEFDATTERILGTTALLALASLLALPAGILLDQRRYRLLAWATIALVVGAFGVAMALIWGTWEPGDEEGLGKALAIGTTLAAAAAQASITTSRRRPDDSTAVRMLYVGAIGLSLAVAVLVTAAVVSETEHEAVFRGIGALIVADLLFVALQSLIRRAAQAGPPSAEGVASLRVTGPAQAIEAAIPELERRGLHVEREG
jgi:drug/metabolite transporter (DMT)-like permease